MATATSTQLRATSGISFRWRLVPGDGDGDVDLFDFAAFLDCVTGPGDAGFPQECATFDFDEDGDLDRADGGALQIAFTRAP